MVITAAFMSWHCEMDTPISPSKQKFVPAARILVRPGLLLNSQFSPRDPVHRPLILSKGKPARETDRDEKGAYISTGVPSTNILVRTVRHQRESQLGWISRPGICGLCVRAGGGGCGECGCVVYSGLFGSVE